MTLGGRLTRREYLNRSMVVGAAARELPRVPARAESLL